MVRIAKGNDSAGKQVSFSPVPRVEAALAAYEGPLSMSGHINELILRALDAAAADAEWLPALTQALQRGVALLEAQQPPPRP